LRRGNPVILPDGATDLLARAEGRVCVSNLGGEVMIAESPEAAIENAIAMVIGTSWL